MSLSGKKILIDAGHGGSDSGASGTVNGQTKYEKDLALLFAQSAKSYIEGAGATVIMTRNSDTAVGINDRWKKGQDNAVDAVISIHFNSGSTSAKGTETFYAQTRSGDKAFAEKLQKRVVEYLGTKNIGVKDDTKAAVGSLGVLRYPTNKNYPRALVEVEYISNSAAMKVLDDQPMYEASLDFAAGILKGLEDHF
ncbi:N-acetylmuramoyl-L-alanine amidase [Paenibacillus uliginis N3/975]|uniref:N-acetylmuramoyl-L-alanine amidase n=1 Tax=Paenibacillus uliginis N3/975 TaxID=1313296 RepID=A0A1X7H1S1_9BACL|nr:MULTISPECIES: N-acetylmuramoyl-L-alanine amidase [Paenibacillus]UNK17134.1 N-acetylmuramoyl-L-alanine amidase [Paenibacillus sp. N3/727]SMF77928.1 N-acetylmuramoyl-L-alanine amidase [Paenibacillus uliginis N3/975]